jgi:hypothetical protein
MNNREVVEKEVCIWKEYTFQIQTSLFVYSSYWDDSLELFRSCYSVGADSKTDSKAERQQKTLSHLRRQTDGNLSSEETSIDRGRRAVPVERFEPSLNILLSQSALLAASRAVLFVSVQL